MKNKYDLEDAIYKAWNLKDHVDMLYRWHGDAPTPMTEDEVSNHLLSISNAMELYFKDLLDVYCQVFELNQYASEEAKARREALFGLPEVKKAIKAVKKENEKAKKK